jgi:transmembrane sensor
LETEERRLLRLLNEDVLSEDDNKWLLDYLNQHDISVLESIAMEQYTAGTDKTADGLSKAVAEQFLRQIHAKIVVKRSRRPKIFIQSLKYAALVFLTLSAGLYFFVSHKEPSAVISKLKTNDIKPGENKAILTFGDGTRVALNNSTNKLLSNKGNIVISQRKEGKVIYQVSGEAAMSQEDVKTEYNTISTPKAGYYHVILSDGTKVWLNAYSSIRFPTLFTGKERRVEISGEAYFEVTKNKNMPFRVVSATQTVEVLGTHFNINAYTDENAVKTTLVEGSVKVIKGTESVLLRPGQQSQNKTTIKVVEIPYIASEISWKDGAFYFKDAGIETVMRQAARWYDLEIKYQGDIPVKQFNGKVSRNVKVSAFLAMFNYSGIKFKVEGRRVTITQ